MAGYHKRKIERGTYGHSSTIHEEVMEFVDAVEQGNQLMALCELADIVGAIKGWLEINHPSIGLVELSVMAEATRHAFADGTRKSRRDPNHCGCPPGTLSCNH